jgi:hypothetical protein
MMIKAISRKDLVSINARLFLNKTNISGATPAIVDFRKEVATKFWVTISNLPNLGLVGAKMKTVAAQPVVLKAIAKLTYDFAFGKKSDEINLGKLLGGVKNIDFSHSNPMWRYYQLSDDDRTSFGLIELKEFLPDDGEGVNRDMGQYDKVAETMRFGAKHNDIFPLIGDMIRWKLGLPSRKKVEIVKAAELDLGQ